MKNDHRQGFHGFRGFRYYLAPLILAVGICLLLLSLLLHDYCGSPSIKLDEAQ